MEALVLWTFVFFGPLNIAGRSVVNMTEQDCRKLEADATRVLGHYTSIKVGACYKQGKAV